MNDSKTCSRCMQELPLTLFGKDSTKKDSLRSCCKLCRKIETKASYIQRSDYWREYRKNNAEKLLQYKREYKLKNFAKIQLQGIEYRQRNKDSDLARAKNHRRANPEMYVNYSHARRVLKNQSTFRVTPKEILKIMSNPCFYCGSPSEHLDHVVALSRGGTHSIGNFAPACSKCNTSKGSKTIMEWRLWKVRLGLQT